MVVLIFFLCCLTTCLTHDIEDVFEDINKETENFNAIGAKIAWESSINPGNFDLLKNSTNYLKNRILWQQIACDKLATLINGHLLNSTQQRQSYLLCRGPTFLVEEARLVNSLYNELQSIYSDADICIPSDIKTTENLSRVEDAILNYLSNVQRFFISKNEHADPPLIAAKIVVNGNFEKNGTLCRRGENDFEKIMEFSKNEKVLRWTWLVWREKVGPPMREPYRRMVNAENLAAMRNGYPNIGAVWRDEMEIPLLRQLCHHLYDSIQPLYKLLHGVVRFYLRRFYGDVVPRRGLIPAHLLGNLWSQNWESLVDLLVPNNLNLDETIKKLNWTVEHMVKRAEDFYQSMGLPAMTDTFWRESMFARGNNKNARCHGTAADMFKDGDYRLLCCSETSKEDFYVLHHEIGHIQYFMAYSNQPALFRQANTALHESIGDSIMYGVLTPQHLNRLNLINDTLLYTSSNTDIIEDYRTNDGTQAINQEDFIEEFKKSLKTKLNLNRYKSKELKQKIETNSELTEFEINNNNNKLGTVFNNDIKEIHDNEYNGPDYVASDGKVKGMREFNSETDNVKLFDEELKIDIVLLLRQALNKIPQIPFSLLMDEYRWKYFEGKLRHENAEFWKMAMEYQGIEPPGERSDDYFDIAAKFHLADNTPYIRYFLSSFLQHQIFESLCKAAIFGRRDVNEPVPKTIAIHRCDIYGSKAAGKLLRDIMSRGHSQNLSEILQNTIGQNSITDSALHRYYRPLYKKLEKFVREHRIPIGW